MKEMSRGHRQLFYMKELGMGNERYVLIDLDNGEVRIDPKKAVEGLEPFSLIRRLCNRTSGSVDVPGKM